MFRNIGKQAGESVESVLNVAQTNRPTNLLELELNDSETPVFRTVYLISVANS